VHDDEELASLRAIVVARRDWMADRGVVITTFGRSFPERDAFEVHYDGPGAITDEIRAEFVELPFTINFRPGGFEQLGRQR
jgi:hypothetical protein